MSLTLKGVYQELLNLIRQLTDRVEKLEAGRVQINFGVVASDAEVRALIGQVVTDVVASTEDGQKFIVGPWMTVQELMEHLAELQEPPTEEVLQSDEPHAPPSPVESYNYLSGMPPPY